MDNLLLKYFKLRMERNPEFKPEFNEPGPVITISREFGCPGKRVAEKFANELTKHTKEEWNWIDKEIINQLSEELKLNPSTVDDLANYTDRKLSDYLALMFSSDYYPGEKKIKNTLSEIILSFANNGNVVILGRAGYLICGKIKRSFHIKLIAPMEWRIDKVSEKKDISYHDAIKFIDEFEIKRDQFQKFFSSGVPNDNDFDIIFDCSVKSDEEIISETFKLIRENRIF